MRKQKFVTELIEYYHEEKVLWNNRVPGYKNKTKRRAALNRISLKTGIAVPELQTKFKSFKTYYRREKAKIKASVNSQDADNIYVSKWPYFAQLDEFLAGHIPRQESLSNLDLDESLIDEDADLEYDDDDDDDNSSETSQDLSELPRRTAANRLKPKNRKRKNEINQHELLLAATTALHTVIKSSTMKVTSSQDDSTDDEESHHGKSFARWLRQIKTPRLQRKAIHQMQEVIFRIKDEDEELRNNSQFYNPFNHHPPQPPINNNCTNFQQFIPHTTASTSNPQNNDSIFSFEKKMLHNSVPSKM